MTKADIVSEIAKSTGIDKNAVLASVESFMSVVKKSLSEGENVYLRGFGSFVVKRRAQKTARNISKNTTMIIPEHDIPSYLRRQCLCDNGPAHHARQYGQRRRHIRCLQ